MSTWIMVLNPFLFQSLLSQCLHRKKSWCFYISQSNVIIISLFYFDIGLIFINTILEIGYEVTHSTRFVSILSQYFFNVGLKTSRLITNLYMVFIFLIYRSIDELALLGNGMVSLIF